MSLVVERASIQRKMKLVEDLAELIVEYNTIALTELYKVRASQLQQLSRTFRDNIHFKVVKNSIIKRTLAKNPKTGINKLAEYLEGSNSLLFSNMNPFKLSILFDKNKINMTAKAGDIAPENIVISAGNTGLPPGPVMSELHGVGIRTRIDIGSVWVVSDTTIVNKGEVIEPKVASVLSKLGVKPLEVGLLIKAAYDDGQIYTADQLQPRIEDVKKQFEEGVAHAFNLAFTSNYPTTETIKMVLQRAALSAKMLALNAAYITPETIQELLANGYRHMRSLSLRLATRNKQAVPREFQ